MTISGHHQRQVDDRQHDGLAAEGCRARGGDRGHGGQQRGDDGRHLAMPRERSVAAWTSLLCQASTYQRREKPSQIAIEVAGVERVDDEDDDRRVEQDEDERSAIGVKPGMRRTENLRSAMAGVLATDLAHVDQQGHHHDQHQQQGQAPPPAASCGPGRTAGRSGCRSSVRLPPPSMRGTT